MQFLGLTSAGAKLMWVAQYTQGTSSCIDDNFDCLRHHERKKSQEAEEVHNIQSTHGTSFVYDQTWCHLYDGEGTAYKHCIYT